MAARPSAAERSTARRRVAGGFVAAVGLSAGMVAFRSGASAVEAGVVVATGTVLGVALLVVVWGRP